MSAEITVGTAYGAKAASRKKPLPRADAESMSSAIASARPSITGTCTPPNSRTRPIDRRKAVSPTA